MCPMNSRLSEGMTRGVGCTPDHLVLGANKLKKAMFSNLYKEL